MIRTSEHIDQLSVALGKFQALAEPLAKDAVNPHLKNRYASLSGIMQTIQPLLTEVGLVVTQAPQGGDGLVGMTTRVLHGESAQWMEHTIVIPIGEIGKGRNLAQEVGSTLTYLRRYTVLAALGLVIDEDDDANAAGPRQQKTGQKPTKRATPAEPPASQAAANPMTDYWNSLGPMERACYRSWDNVRGAVGDLGRYSSPQAITGVIRKLYPGFTENGYPTEADAEHGRVRVAVYRTVKAYAELRENGMEPERAVVMAFETAKNAAHA